jgi:hypothetical protein
MLARLKTASPKWRILIGLWIAVEILSLPAAAGMAFSFTQPDDPRLVAERLDTDDVGMSQFLVTHQGAFDVTVSGIENDVYIKVEDAHSEQVMTSHCAHLTSPNPRIVKTVSAPSNPDAPLGLVYVTLIHSELETPEIAFEPASEWPVALPCRTS